MMLNWWRRLIEGRRSARIEKTASASDPPCFDAAAVLRDYNDGIDWLHRYTEEMAGGLAVASASAGRRLSEREIEALADIGCEGLSRDMSAAARVEGVSEDAIANGLVLAEAEFRKHFKPAVLARLATLPAEGRA